MTPETIFDGKYRILSDLGQGGAGLVYRAEHVFLRKKMALKLLRPEYASQPEIAMRFENEARATSLLDHENIIRVIDFGRAQSGEMYLVMELLPGRSLFEELSNSGIPAVARALVITQQILSGLEAAHEHGIVHRDLKPENVFLVDRPSGGDLIKLLDFGIAKLERATVRMTTTGSLLGTPLYMSPEQARGETDIDARTDLHAVGVILYELLTGRTPYFGDNYNIVLFQIIRGEPPPLPPTVDPALAAIVMRAIAPKRDARWPSARAMREELVRYVESRGGEARPATPAVSEGDRAIEKLQAAQRNAIAERGATSDRAPPAERSPAGTESTADAEQAAPEAAPAAAPEVKAGRPGRISPRRPSSTLAYADAARRTIVEESAAEEEEPIQASVQSADGSRSPTTLPGTPELRVDVPFATTQVFAMVFRHEIRKGKLSFELASPVEKQALVELALGLPGGVLIELRGRVTECLAATARKANPTVAARRRGGPRFRVLAQLLPIDEAIRTEMERAAGLLVDAPPPDPVSGVSGALTFEERKLILNRLCECFERSPIATLTEPEALRALLRDTLRMHEGILVLDRTYRALLTLPGVDAAMLQEPLHEFSQIEDELPLPVRLVRPSIEERIARRRRGASDESVDDSAVLPTVAPARPTVGASEREPTGSTGRAIPLPGEPNRPFAPSIAAAARAPERAIEASRPSAGPTSGSVKLPPRPVKIEHPSAFQRSLFDRLAEARERFSSGRNARVIVAVVTVVSLSLLAASSYATYHHDQAAWDTSDVVTILHLGQAVRLGDTVTARIEELRWEKLASLEQQRLVDQLFDVERRRGIHVLRLLDLEGHLRATAADVGGLGVQIDVVP